MEILRTLGDADESLSFSKLRDRVGPRDSGQFNYHLGKLEGHFVTQTDDGYVLRRAGESVLEAVLSEAVTEAPVLERTRINQSCFLCGAPVEVSYAQERFGVYCTECDGTYGGGTEIESSADPDDNSKFGYLPLPPAGVQGRTSRRYCRRPRPGDTLKISRQPVAFAHAVRPLSMSR